MHTFLFKAYDSTNVQYDYIEVSHNDKLYSIGNSGNMYKHGNYIFSITVTSNDLHYMLNKLVSNDYKKIKNF